MTQDEYLEILKPELTPEFLAMLVKSARAIGWRVDYIELTDFVEELFKVVDMEVPNLTPIKFESQQDDHNGTKRDTEEGLTS